MKVVFLGKDTFKFRDGIDELLRAGAEIVCLDPKQDSSAIGGQLLSADVVVSSSWTYPADAAPRLRLLQGTGAGLNRIDLGLVPASAHVCNCYGHEIPIAEYVFAAMLSSTIPLFAADASLRRGEWSHKRAFHGELSGYTLGLLGWGKIGRTVAERARAFGMPVVVANRSDPGPDAGIGGYFPLDALPAFAASVDFLVVALALTRETAGLVDAAVLAAMRPDGYLINVSRGEIVHEEALFEALRDGRIRGAALDVWYRYPDDLSQTVLPSRLPFQTLPNILMTPHISGWSTGMIGRRRRAIAENIQRVAAGKPPRNAIRTPV